MKQTITKQQRIENILLSLKRFDYLTRSQIQTIHNLKGTRNANRVLKSMEEYLSSFRRGLEKVYYLSKAGRERVQCDVIRKKHPPNIEHYLLRNQLWIHLKRPYSWENEVKLTVGDISIISDAKFNQNGVPVFVEVDVLQPMIKNRAKIEKYKKIRQLTNDPFHVVWVTSLESRRPKLQELSVGLSGHVFTYNEIK